MMNDEGKDLKPKENDDLEAMMEQASKGVDDNFKEDNEDDGKSTKRVIVITSIGLALFIIILIIGAVLLQRPQDFEDKTAEPDWVSKEDDFEDDDYFIEEEHPVEVYEWAKQPYDEDTFWEEGIEDEILEVSKDDYRNFYFAISWMPSGLENEFNDGELDGPYTNDVEQRYLDDVDGEELEENPEFSYALVEDYEKAIVVHTERLLNPTFGGWASAQISMGDGREIKDERYYNNLRNIFSEDWWEANIKEHEDYTKLPVMAEWNIGEWDKYNLAERETFEQGVFYGQLNETEGNIIETEIVGLDEEDQPIVDVSIPVKYAALDENGESLEVLGNLKLTFESNQNSIDVRERVVISDAELMLE